MSRESNATIIVLFILVLLSLALNGFLLWQWWTFQQQAQARLAEAQQTVTEMITKAVTDLEAFENSTLQFDIPLEQELPLQMQIPFDETIEVPIQTSIPISQEIKSTILLDPFQSGLKIPTDVTVPVQMEVPIDFSVPIALDRPLPISTTIPIELNVPIAIKISETELAPYLARLRQNLASLEKELSASK
ncbi:MAG: hypothetical protein AB1801_19200 [Chloroflexota bacterium]